MEVDQDNGDQEMAPEEPSPVKEKSKDAKMESPDKKPPSDRKLRAHKEPRKTSLIPKIFKKEEIKERKSSKPPNTSSKNSGNTIKVETSEKKVSRRRSTKRKSRK